MKIEVQEIIPRATERYPYTHRVAVYWDALAADKVSKWLADNNIPHTKGPWGVYYLHQDHVMLLLLKWS
jgi:hypothetical protein